MRGRGCSGCAFTNVRGVVEVTPGTHAYQLDNYTDYDSYGNPITGIGGTQNMGGLTKANGTDADSATSFGFGGGFTDATALIYLVNRYYDSGTGQFISVDPDVGSTGTPFAYATDDPSSRVDPLGLYAYDYYWNLGPSSTIGSAAHVYDYFGGHLQQVFPFPISCELAILGAHCTLRPSVPYVGIPIDQATVDQLFVEAKVSPGNPQAFGDFSFTFQVTHWYTSWGHKTVDAAGSKIKFSVFEVPHCLFLTKNCSVNQAIGGPSDVVLEQTGKAHTTRYNGLANYAAFFTWHDQAQRLSTQLGGPGARFISEWSFGTPCKYFGQCR